ncbi:MAG: hypothetical protein WBV72_02575, partial [Nitrososphaeraceae archaeon]
MIKSVQFKRVKCVSEYRLVNNMKETNFFLRRSVLYLNTIMLPTSLLQYKKKKVIQYPDCGGYR